MRRWAIPLLLAALFAVAGCDSREPVSVSRESLGTVVSVTAYGEDEAAVREAIDAAYAEMAEVEAAVDAYDSDSAISRFNANPYEPQTLPAEAREVLDAVVELEASAEFSPALLSVMRLYRFGEGGRVPDSDDLALALLAAGRFGCTGDGRASFARLSTPDERLEPGGELAPGIDLGGAAKGLALDRAREVLRESGSVTAAIITSGSSTVTLGTKPDGSPWFIGVEDPREPSVVIATFSFEADGALSTSGDYQQYFESEGVRYHHILDPATGLPARTFRSLTVAGSSLSGLHSDILSTALFIKGREGAESYAAEREIALFAVDAEGQTLIVPAPAESGVDVAAEATPQK